jgi:hypothetical protein
MIAKVFYILSYSSFFMRCALLIMVLLLCSQFALAADYSVSDLKPIVYDLNEHAGLLNVSRELRLPCVRIDYGADVFTVVATDRFLLTDDLCNFRFRISQAQFNTAVGLALEGRHSDAARYTLKVMPFFHKARLFVRCLKSPACRLYMNKYL